MTELFTLSKRCAHGFVQQSQCEACKTESSLAAIEIENSRLRGESKVLRDLLEAVIDPLSTLMEDDDHYMVGAALLEKIKLALRGTE